MQRGIPDAMTPRLEDCGLMGTHPPGPRVGTKPAATRLRADRGLRTFSGEAWGGLGARWAGGMQLGPARWRDDSRIGQLGQRKKPWRGMRNALHETEREATRDVGVGVYSAAFSPDGTRVATCHNDGVVQVWEVKPPGMRVGGAWDAGGHAARGSLIGMRARFPGWLSARMAGGWRAPRTMGRRVSGGLGSWATGRRS